MSRTVPLKITADELKPTKQQVARMEKAGRVLYFSAKQMERVRRFVHKSTVSDALRKHASDHSWYLWTLPVIEGVGIFRGVEIYAGLKNGSGSYYTEYIHRPDRCSDRELSEYVGVAVERLLGRIRWEHD